MYRAQWRSYIRVPRFNRVAQAALRMRGFNFRSKPYQDFSLGLDGQLAWLVRKWQGAAAACEPHCSAGHSASELG